MASSTPDQTTTATGSVVMDTNVFAMMWCPTFMNLDESVPTVTDTNHIRERSDIYFKGFSEKWSINIGAAAQLYWRRIMFWSNDRYDVAAPIQSAFAEDTYFRPLRPMQFANSEPDRAIINLIFRGVQGVDWTQYINAPVDTKRIRLHSDKTTKLEAKIGVTNISEDDELTGVGYFRRSKTAFVNKSLTYADEEAGTDDTSSPWQATGGRSQGNLYVFDLFSYQLSNTRLANPIRPLPSFGCDAVVYWHER